MDDTLRSCREFTEVLASDAPTPGGGGAAGASAGFSFLPAIMARPSSVTTAISSTRPTNTTA